MDQGHLWVVRVRARRRGEFVDAIADIQADGKVLIINLQVTPVSAWKTSPVQAVTFPSRCASCTGVNLNLRQHYTGAQSAVGSRSSHARRGDLCAGKHTRPVDSVIATASWR